jgi:hypothetical protein
MDGLLKKPYYTNMTNLKKLVCLFYTNMTNLKKLVCLLLDCIASGLGAGGGGFLEPVAWEPVEEGSSNQWLGSRWRRVPRTSGLGAGGGGFFEPVAWEPVEEGSSNQWLGSQWRRVPRTSGLGAGGGGFLEPASCKKAKCQCSGRG